MVSCWIARARDRAIGLVVECQEQSEASATATRDCSLESANILEGQATPIENSLTSQSQ